jgi:Cu+-exporting ATPase
MKKLLYLFIVLAFASCQSENKGQAAEDQAEEAELVEITIHVGGMHCDMCVNSIEKGIAGLEGIRYVKASLEDSTAVVKYDASKTGLDQIEKAVEKRGYAVKKDL